jgi:hypothetical protein
MYPNVECVIISGVTAAAIKIAFDTWRDQWVSRGNSERAVVVSATMFGVTDLIVFYFRITN